MTELSLEKLLSRVTDLEVRLTYQQRLIDELNGVVTDQTLRLLRLEKQLSTMVTQQSELRTQLREHLPNLPHEKPPHY